MKIYPSFNEVFANDELLGVFYPLCSGEHGLHFVSSNGLWMDEQYKTEHNSSHYVMFEIKNGKYDFRGDIRLYQGYDYAKKIFPILEDDFNTNGNDYLAKKIKPAFYIEKITKILPPQTRDAVDLDYYLNTFYEFSINKLNYNLNGKFGEFNHLIKGYAKPDKSPIIYNEKEHGGHPMDDNLIKSYCHLGAVIGYEFFTDGNDTVLFYNEKENKVLSANHYS